ncbi:pentatricopeptide repeat-containing protein At1g10910, chloroplastic [Aristolochia californica]|uniref:pentatricopeptide repeat-containing protein At1g10910, chloroplastic n=1 Tax=Aristolochia californica TaxID=171875 RepID=UPI0035DB2FF6
MQIFPLAGGVQPFPASYFSSAPSLTLPIFPKSDSCRVCSVACSERTPRSSSSSSPADVVEKPNHAVSLSSRRAAVAAVQKSTDLASSLSSTEQVLQVQDLNIILRYFGESKRWQDASQIFYWMQSRGKTNFASYSSFIKFMGKSHDPKLALQAYSTIQDDSTRHNVSICNAVLGCLIRNGKFDSSLKLFSEMKKGGLKPDVVTYSTLLSGCMKAKLGYPKALEIIQEMKANCLQMDEVIYGTLLAICASNNLVKEAKTFFQQMKDDGLVPNIFHYSSLLNAYSVEGNCEEADKLLQDMTSAGLVPNKVLLTTLLKVYVRGRFFEKSRELLVELEKLGHAQEEMPYCLLMDGLAKAGHIDEARAVFNDIRNKDVKSDGYAYSIMISAYCRSHQVDEAKQLARDFEACFVKYDLVMLNTLLTAYCRAGEMDSVMQLLKKMDEMAISPDCKTFRILIKYFAKERLYQLGYRMVEDMHGKGYQLDEELCTDLILQLGRAGASLDAFSVYNMLRYGKRTISKALHDKVLNILVDGGLYKDAYVVLKDNLPHISRYSTKRFVLAFMRFGNINLINDVIKALHNSGHRINQEVFQLAVSRYIRKPEKKELLLHLMQWMAGQGYVVDSSSRNLLLKKSDLFGRQVLAETLSKQHIMSKKLRKQ